MENYKFSYVNVRDRIPYGRVCLRPAEIQLLTKYVMETPGDHVEIGTLWGGSAIVAALAKQTADRGEIVYTIDPMNTGYWQVGDPSHSNIIPTKERVLANFQFFGVANQIRLIQYKSFPWPLSTELTFGTVFIDGDHQAEAVIQDFNSVRLLTSIILFHDYDPLHPIHKNILVPTVDKIIDQHKDDWEIVEIVETILVFRKRING
jgi:hypothetical protein